MEYTIKRYKRARHVKVGVNARGTVVVTAPKWGVSKKFIDAFVGRHALWLRAEQAKRASLGESPLSAVSREAYKEHKEAARVLAHARLAHFNTHYNFAYDRVFIRNTTSRWGSCSSKRNLSFNYKIALLPPGLADYIIVHELCHLKEMNHSPAFWALVAESIPSHAACRAALRKLSKAGV